MLIKRHMDLEVQELQTMVADIGRHVLEMLELAMANIALTDPKVFDPLFKIETEVNRLQMKIDDLAWKIMALYQPTASDLRILIGGIKVASDLERAGDEVCAVCRRVMEVGGIPRETMAPHLQEMMIMVKSLLKDSLFAIANLDEMLAESIFAADDAIDEAFQGLFVWVEKGLEERKTEIRPLLAFLAMGRSLERIADHATNLAEIAIFMKKGQDVRHHGLKF